MRGKRRWGTVLTREASRTSKRWQLYLMRVGSGVLVGGMMLAVLLLFGTDKPELYPRLGGYLFNAYAMCLLFGAGGVAPVVMAQAMLEERESGTLETICLSNVKPMDLLTGKLGTTVGFLLMLAIGTLPIGLLPITLGGVAPQQAVSLGAAVVGLALASGSVAAVVALVSRSVAIPVLSTFVWVALVPMTIPIMSTRGLKRLSGGHGQEFQFAAVQSGIFGPFTDKWTGLLGCLPLFMVAVTSLWVAASLFKRGTLHGFDELRTPKLLRYGWPLLVAYLATYWRLMYIVSSYSNTWPAGIHPYIPYLSIVAAWAAQVALSLVLLQATISLVPLLTRTNKRRWPVIFPNLPVLQREIFSGAHGPLGKFLLVLIALWMVATVVAAWTSGEQEIFFAGGIIGVLGTSLTSSLIITNSIAGERKRDTLSLLSITTMNKHKLLYQKVTGALIRSLVPAILCLCMAVIASRGRMLGLGNYSTPAIFLGQPLVRLTAIIIWTLCVWNALTLSQALIAVRIRNTSAVWAINALVGSIVPLAVMIIGVLLGERRTLSPVVRFVGNVLFPFQKEWRNSGASTAMFVSIVMWGALAALLWWVTVRAFERHGHRR